MSSSSLLLSTLGDWARAIAALPADGPLPQRTVLVPSERHAHALRRELSRSGQARALAGTRFVSPGGAAAAVLEGRGVAFTAGEGALRPTRLLRLFREDLALEHFELDLLRSTLGWDEAFASAISDLEAAGLAPADVPRDQPLLRDLAALWARVADDAGTSFTSARVQLEAAALLASDRSAWPWRGGTLALVTGHETTATARFVTAVPGVTIALRTARPLRERHVARVRALYGPDAAAVIAHGLPAPGSPPLPASPPPGERGMDEMLTRDLLPASPPPGERGMDEMLTRDLLPASPAPITQTERDLLAAYLFQPPEVLASPDRPRSRGPDGTVHLEEHAGIEAELEAAADWVARKVLEGVPLEEVAVLVAAQDPLAQLVADRIARLEVGGAPLPVYVAGGVPAVSTAAGARVLATVRAISAHLAADRLALVLPGLRIERGGAGDAPDARAAPARREGGAAADAPEAPGLPARRGAAVERAPRPHLTHGEALELAYSLGTVGGNAANPRGALAWSERAAARIGELEAALRRAHTDDDSSAREVWRLERTLRNVAAVRPALDALVGVARTVVEARPLAAVAEALCGFLKRWLLAPGEGAAIPARLEEALAPACHGALGRALTGAAALQVIEARLLSMRVPRRRFGEPAVYVGTVASAAGLEFEATRVISLCEGVLPSQPHESPVLPERVREALEAAAPGRVLPRAADRVALQTYDLFAAVAGARGQVVLSAPRVDVARTEREASAVFIEAAAAIARPDAATGAQAPPVPDSAALARDFFAPAREAAAAFRAAHPVSELAWLVGAAGRAPLRPPRWTDEPVLALDRVSMMRFPNGPLGPGDGVLGDGDPFPPVPGVDAKRPISASALQQLLQCPRMFLMRRILGWDEPAGAPPLRELDALSFGSLLHRAVEAFYRAHGDAFVAGSRSLGHWREVAFGIADGLFEEFLSEYPLVGAGVREKERERLRDALGAFLEHDGGRYGRARRFVGVEVAFGEDAPLEVVADGVTLHLRGFIDRLDVVNGVTLVRDLKSGKAHPRRGEEAGPTPFRDVQLGVYALATRKLAAAWKVPRRLAAAYVYASGRGEVEERAFREDFAELEEATAGWLATAGQLLAARAFPPTPDQDDCRYCPFAPVCGDGAVERARAGLADADGPLGRFGALKLGDEEDEG